MLTFFLLYLLVILTIQPSLTYFSCKLWTLFWKGMSSNGQLKPYNNICIHWLFIDCTKKFCFTEQPLITQGLTRLVFIIILEVILGKTSLSVVFPLREICQYAWVNRIPHKSVMPSYVDRVMK